MKVARIVVGVLVLFLAAQGVMAESLGTVRMRHESTSPSKYIKLYYNWNEYGYVTTGQFNMKIDMNYAATGEGIDIQNLADSNDRIGMFCADLFQSTPGYYTTYDVNLPEDGPVGGSTNGYLFPDGMGSTRATHLRRLYETHLDDVTGETSAAAFQMAIWEILYEKTGEYELSRDNSGDRGSFYARNTTYDNVNGSISLASDWLDDVVAQSGNPEIRLRILTDPCKQDYAMILPEPTTPNDPVIPEPLTLLALTAGVGGLGGYLKKRFSTKVV